MKSPVALLATSRCVAMLASRPAFTEITYYGNATAKSKGTFKLGTPDANGIATLTGSGQYVGATGKSKGLKSTHTYSGTFNIKTGVFSVTLTGAYTF